MDIVQTCFKQQPGLGAVAFTDLCDKKLSYYPRGAVSTLHVMEEVKVRTVEKVGRNHPRFVCRTVSCVSPGLVEVLFTVQFMFEKPPSSKSLAKEVGEL